MLPFTKRTTTAVTVFACLQIAKQAQQLTNSGAQITALQLEHAALFHTYRRLLHQDIANQHAVLDAIITMAATSITALSVALQNVTTPTNADQVIVLADYQLVVENAMIVMLMVQAAE